MWLSDISRANVEDHIEINTDRNTETPVSGTEQQEDETTTAITIVDEGTTQHSSLCL